MYLILWLLIIGKLSPIYDYVRFFFVLYRGGGRGGQGGEEGRGVEENTDFITVKL